MSSPLLLPVIRIHIHPFIFNLLLKGIQKIITVFVFLTIANIDYRLILLVEIV